MRRAPIPPTPSPDGGMLCDSCSPVFSLNPPLARLFRGKAERLRCLHRFGSERLRRSRCSLISSHTEVKRRNRPRTGTRPKTRSRAWSKEGVDGRGGKGAIWISYAVDYQQQDET